MEKETYLKTHYSNMPHFNHTESGKELHPFVFAGLRPNIQLKFAKLNETPKWLNTITNGDYLQWRDECLLENLVNHSERAKVLTRMETREYKRRPVIKAKRQKRDWQLWTELEVETLIEMKNAGKSYKEIARYLGTKHERIKSKWLNMQKVV